MSDALLRRYSGTQIGEDGYPYAWHNETQAVDQTNRHPGDGPRLEPAIKHLIRELAGHRCLRCGHPYPPGIARTHPNGEYTPCDAECQHGPPGRWRLSLRDGWTPWLSGTRDTLPRFAVVEAHWRILTVHHLDEDKANCCWWNLAALCQRCHLRMQRAVVMGRPYHYTHSDWFRPFAAGFYAWKYEGADLSREEVEARLDELLAYELRFTQEELEV